MSAVVAELTAILPREAILEPEGRFLADLMGRGVQGHADAVAMPPAFGGGGQARAAGCTVVAPLAAAREQVLAECERELARVDAGGR